MTSPTNFSTPTPVILSSASSQLARTLAQAEFLQTQTQIQGVGSGGSGSGGSGGRTSPTIKPIPIDLPLGDSKGEEQNDELTKLIEEDKEKDKGDDSSGMCG